MIVLQAAFVVGNCLITTRLSFYHSQYPNMFWGIWRVGRQIWSCAAQEVNMTLTIHEKITSSHNEYQFCNRSGMLKRQYDMLMADKKLVHADLWQSANERCQNPIARKSPKFSGSRKQRQSTISFTKIPKNNPKRKSENLQKMRNANALIWSAISIDQALLNKEQTAAKFYARFSISTSWCLIINLFQLLGPYDNQNLTERMQPPVTRKEACRSKLAG
jgi:hypothetical protein